MTRNFNLQTRPSSLTSSLHHQVTSSGRIVPITPTQLLLLVVDQCLVLISSRRNGTRLPKVHMLWFSAKTAPHRQSFH